MSISLKQRDFIRYYVLTKNATESAKQAGYSHRSAYSTGCRLLKNGDIKTEVLRQCNERVAEYNITKQQYEHKTLDLHKKEKQRNVKARYWELLGKSKGFIKPEGTQNIALFSELGKALQDNYNKVKDIKKDRQQLHDDKSLLDGVDGGEKGVEGEGTPPLP